MKTGYPPIIKGRPSRHPGGPTENLSFPQRDAVEASVRTRRARSEALIAVSAETISVMDVVESAIADEASPLRRIKIRQLLAAQPGWSVKRSRQAVATLTFGSRLRDPQETRITWLIDDSGDRVAALAEIISPRRGQAPWSGWPYAPAPAGTRGYS